MAWCQQTKLSVVLGPSDIAADPGVAMQWALEPCAAPKCLCDMRGLYGGLTVPPPHFVD